MGIYNGNAGFIQKVYTTSEYPEFKIRIICTKVIR